MKELLKGVVYSGIVAIMFLPLMVTGSMFFPYITGKNFWFRIIVEVITAAWLLLALYDKQYRPRFSWVMPGMLALLVVMFFADLFGVHPATSFWSNYERMDGYVMLAHFVLFFSVLAHITVDREIDVFGFKTTPWKIILGAALAGAIGVAFNAFQQITGVEATTMGWRVNATLGNAAYMAVYMLFNTFIAVWLWMHTKQTGLKVTFAGLAVLFMFLLVQTATRGTILGLIAGGVVGALYIALTHAKERHVQKVALGIIVVLAIIVSSFAALRNTSFVQDNLILQRATAVGASELSLRFDIWKIALKGAAERPVLGWGQNNFNYVFNQYYQADFAHRAEQWYDRAHDVFLDWLIAGGVLGLLAYLSLFVAILYYVLWLPLRGRDSGFSSLERGLLLGITAAYFIHNLVVFDNLVSYIFFALLLALVHSRVATPIRYFEQLSISGEVVSQVAAPIMILVLGFSIYIVNVPSMQAAHDLINAFVAQTPTAKMQAFDQALERHSFARQEITEQMIMQEVTAAQDPQATALDVQQFMTDTQQRVEELLAFKPGDARLEFFATDFYKSIGNIEAARSHAAKARALSPNKPQIVVEQGLVEYQAGDFTAMRDFMQQAYQLDPQYVDAQKMYAASLLLTGVGEGEIATIIASSSWPQVANDSLFLSVVDAAGATSTLARIFQTRIDAAPTTTTNYLSLSFVYYRDGNIAGAIDALEQAKTNIPSVALTVNCFIANLKAGIDPNTGCQ